MWVGGIRSVTIDTRSSSCIWPRSGLLPPLCDLRFALRYLPFGLFFFKSESVKVSNKAFSIGDILIIGYVVYPLRLRNARDAINTSKVGINAMNVPRRLGMHHKVPPLQASLRNSRCWKALTTIEHLSSPPIGIRSLFCSDKGFQICCISSHSFFDAPRKLSVLRSDEKLLKGLQLELISKLLICQRSIYARFALPRGEGLLDILKSELGDERRCLVVDLVILRGVRRTVCNRWCRLGVYKGHCNSKVIVKKKTGDCLALQMDSQSLKGVSWWELSEERDKSPWGRTYSGVGFYRNIKRSELNDGRFIDLELATRVDHMTMARSGHSSDFLAFIIIRGNEKSYGY